jgi:hypothetical protein
MGGIHRHDDAVEIEAAQGGLKASESGLLPQDELAMARADLPEERSSEHAMYVINRHGLYLAVCGERPALWSVKRDRKSSVSPS